MAIKHNELRPGNYHKTAGLEIPRMDISSVKIDGQAYYLLWNYNREQFYKQITSDVNSYQTRAKHKLKKMLEKSNPLKVFADYLKVKPQQLEPIDDLPFCR